jgi:hypothetical protein
MSTTAAVVTRVNRDGEDKRWRFYLHYLSCILLALFIPGLDHICSPLIYNIRPCLCLLHSLFLLIFCATGVVGAFLMYGVAQEEIYAFKSKDGEKMSLTLFLLLTQVRSYFM